MKIKLNHGGIAKLLKEVAEPDIARRTENIRAAAGEGFESETSIGRSRARGAVWTASWEAMEAEARDRALTRAIDAGRR